MADGNVPGQNVLGRNKQGINISQEKSEAIDKKIDKFYNTLQHFTAFYTSQMAKLLLGRS